MSDHKYLTGTEIMLIVGAVAILGAAAMAAWPEWADLIVWGA